MNQISPDTLQTLSNDLGMTVITRLGHANDNPMSFPAGF